MRVCTPPLSKVICVLYWAYIHAHVTYKNTKATATLDRNLSTHSTSTPAAYTNRVYAPGRARHTELFLTQYFWLDWPQQLAMHKEFYSRQ